MKIVVDTARRPKKGGPGTPRELAKIKLGLRQGQAEDVHTTQGIGRGEGAARAAGHPPTAQAGLCPSLKAAAAAAAESAAAQRHRLQGRKRAGLMQGGTKMMFPLLTRVLCPTALTSCPCPCPWWASCPSWPASRPWSAACLRHRRSWSHRTAGPGLQSGA